MGILWRVLLSKYIWLGVVFIGIAYCSYHEYKQYREYTTYNTNLRHWHSKIRNLPKDTWTGDIPVPPLNFVSGSWLEKIGLVDYHQDEKQDGAPFLSIWNKAFERQNNLARHQTKRSSWIDALQAVDDLGQTTGTVRVNVGGIYFIGTSAEVGVKLKGINDLRTRRKLPDDSLLSEIYHSVNWPKVYLATKDL